MTAPASYCKSCDGYTAEVGNLDEDGWCQCCNYRNTLQTIRDRDAVENALDPQWAARMAMAILAQYETLPAAE